MIGFTDGRVEEINCVMATPTQANIDAWECMTHEEQLALPAHLNSPEARTFSYDLTAWDIVERARRPLASAVSMKESKI
jgi:hypothetical protein